MDIEKRMGVALLVLKEIEEEVLMGKRIGRHGNGTWGPPGGKRENFETVQDACLREFREETGLTELNLEMIDVFPCAITQDSFPDGLNFITAYLRARYINGIPKVMEPKNCEEWKFYPWSKLPEPLFIPIKNLVAQGYNPFRGLK